MITNHWTKLLNKKRSTVRRRIEWYRTIEHDSIDKKLHARGKKTVISNNDGKFEHTDKFSFIYIMWVYCLRSFYFQLMAGFSDLDVQSMFGGRTYFHAQQLKIRLNEGGRGLIPAF